jgi:hypothetical protein
LCMISCHIGTLPFAICSSEFVFLESDEIWCPFLGCKQ